MRWAIHRTDKMQVHFIDNTDPDGIARALSTLEGKLAETLMIVMHQERWHARDCATAC